MSDKQLSTEESSTDENNFSIIDDHNSKLILDLIKSSLQKSYLDSSYRCGFWRIEEIYVISNEKLEANYREKSEELKASHENLYPTTLFTCYRTHSCLNDIAVHGLRTRPTGFNILGDNSKGVTLCQHADIQLKAAEARPSRCFLFLFACMSSRIARIDCCDQGRNNRCPVSGYDCHISSIRPSLCDSLLVQAVRAQIYFYDVNGEGIYFSHPRQCLPLACVVYTRSESSETTASVRIKHFEVGHPLMPAGAVVDLTGSDETIPLLDEAKGASVYNRLRRHFRKSTSAEEIYCLSNYFPKPVNEKSSVVASSVSGKGASTNKVAQSSSQPKLAATGSAVTTAGTGQERATPDSLREKMSQFCVNKNQKNPNSVPSVTVPNPVSSPVGIIIATNVVPSTGGTTFQPYTISWTRSPTMAANTVSCAAFVPNVQDSTVTANAMPRAALGTTVGASIVPRTLTPRTVGAAAAATTSQVLRAAACGTTVGQASLPQCPRLVRYVPRILRPPTGLGGIRLLSNSNTVAMSPPVTSSRTVSGAVPTLPAPSTVPLVTRPHSVAMMASMPSFNGGSNIRPNTLLSSNTVPRVPQPQFATLMAAMPSSFAGGTNIRPNTTFGGIAIATQLSPQQQTILPLQQGILGNIIPLYGDRSQVNLLAPRPNCGPQAQLTRPAACQQLFLAGTSINPAGMVSPISQSPFIFHVPPNLAQFTVTRSADQQRSSVSAAASEQNLFFGGSGVDEITIEDEGLVISGVRPIVIMPDGTCDEDEEQNHSLSGGVQGSAETKTNDCNKVSACDVGILKTEEKSTCSRVKNRKSSTIILDADLPMNEGESNSEVTTELTDHRLVDQEMDEDGDLLDRQLRISDVVSLQTDSDLNDSSEVHRRLLDEMWMENDDQVDSVSRPVENSLSSSNCNIISLASVAVKNAPQVSASLSSKQAEIVTVEPNTEMSASDEPVQRPIEDCLVHPTASVSVVASSPQMQDDAQASENNVGEKTAEKEPASSADGSSITRGSQTQQKTLLQTLLSEPVRTKQKPLSCDFNKLPVSGLQKHDQPSTGVCLPASEESASATKESSAKQRQMIPVFTVCADGSVSIRLDNETEANEDVQNTKHCDVRIELLKDVLQKDTLMKALANVLGNIHVTDLRNSTDEIVCCSKNKNTEEITSSSLNLQRDNLGKVNGVEQRTGLEKDSCNHMPATPDSDNDASDTNILIESVHSMDLEKFDEISKSSGNAKPVDPLLSRRVTSENDEEGLKRLDDTMIHTSRANGVGSMNTSDFEENDVEDDEPFQICENETEKFSVSAPQTSEGFRQQCKFSDVTCSTESSSAKLNDLVSGIEDITQLATKSHSKSYAASAELPLGSRNKSEISKLNKRRPLRSTGESKTSRIFKLNIRRPLHSTGISETTRISKLNKRRPLHSTSESETSRIINKEVLFECGNSGLNEELPSKESHNVGVCEEEHSNVCGELPFSLGVESEISRLQTTIPLNSVNISKPSKVVEQLIMNSAMETCRMNEQLIDVVNESETCNLNNTQPVDMETESETCGISNKQSLLLANEPEILETNQELLLDSGTEHSSFRTCEELHLHVTNEHNVDLAKESETCRMHEQQQLDLASESASLRAHEEQHLDLASESETCRTDKGQPLDLASESESCKTHEGQPVDLTSESESCRTDKGQPLDLASESESCRTDKGQPLDLASESESCRTQIGQQLDLPSESESCRTQIGQQLDLASESESLRAPKEQHLDLASESESCRTDKGQHLGLVSESKTCRIHEEQQLDLTIESELCRTREEQYIDLTIESELCRTCEEQHIDLTNDSDTCSIHEEPQSESCRMHEQQHLDLTDESETLGIDKQLPLEIANETGSVCEEPLLKLADKLPITKTSKESPLNLAIEWGKSGVNENVQMANAANSVDSDFKTSETLLLRCLNSVTPACVAEGVSPISPACATEEISFAHVTEAISSAYVTEAMSSACVTEAISPASVTEAISPASVTEAISSPSVTEAISPVSVTEAISTVSVTEAISPASVTEAISPVSVTEAISPVSVTEAISSPSVTEAISSPSVTEAISPASVAEAISPVSVTEAISPASVTEAISPVSVTEAISPAYVTEAISPATETEAISPASITEAISPAYIIEAISPAYVTEAISPAYITEPISPAYVTEPISPPVCSDEPIFPTSTYKLVTENVSPPCDLEEAPAAAHAVTSVHEIDSIITSDGFLCSSTFPQSGPETNLNCHCISKSDSNTGIAGVDDNSAVLDVFHSKNKHFLESVKKSVESDSETTHQTPHASEMKAVIKKKKVLSLEEYKKLKESIREVENLSNLQALETRVQNMSLNPSSLHLDKHQLDEEKGLGAEGSCHSQLVTSKLTRGTEERPDDHLKIINSVVNLDLKLSKNVMEESNSAVIDSVRPRDPRLQGRGWAFKNAEVTWNNPPSEMDKEKQLDEARVHLIPKEQFVDLDEDVVESSSQNMDKLLNDKAVEDMNVMATEQLDRLEIESIGGDEEQENAVKWGSKVIDEENKDEESPVSGSDGMEPGEIEDESCICEAAAAADVEQVANKQVIEVLDDWDECGDFVIMGSDLDVLSDDGRESGEVTSDSSDEFGDLVLNDGADDNGEYDCSLQQRKSLEGEPDQEHVWHLLDDALTVGGKGETGDNAPATVKQQLKGRDKKVWKKGPIIIKLNKNEVAKRLAQDDKVPGKDYSQENAGARLKENSKGTERRRSQHSHRKHKSGSKNSCRSHRTRRSNSAGNLEFPSAEHLKISDEKREYRQPSEDRWDIYQGVFRNFCSEDRLCTPIDVEIIKVLRNVDDISSERSVFGSADSFVTLLMKEFQHLPEASQKYYNECIRETLQVDKEFVTSEHIYGSMAELLTEEQRQHIQLTNISPVVARELHLEDILKKVKLELGVFKSEPGCDLSHHNLLVLTKEMLYDQLNDLKCYQKSRSVFVLPDELRLLRESGKYISVDGSLLFLSRCTLSVKKCCELYCYRTEIEEMEEELNESLGDARGLTEEICRKLSVLHLKRRNCLQDIGCSADQLLALKKKFSKNLNWFRRMRNVLQSRDRSQDGQEMALVTCLNQRIKKLRDYIKVITRLKTVGGIWYPDNSERTQL